MNLFVHFFLMELSLKNEPRGGEVFKDCRVLKAVCVSHEFVCACFFVSDGVKS